MSTTTEKLAARKAAVFARATDKVLIEAMRTLDALKTPTGDQISARVSIVDELERRHPEVQRIVDDLIGRDIDNASTYVDMLTAALASVGVSA